MDYEPVDSFSPAKRLTPNRAPGISLPLLHQDMPHLAPNRWQDPSESSHEGNHQTFEYKQQVSDLTERVLAVAKLLALPLAASAYLVFCIIVNKRLTTLKNNGFYAFSPDHIATIKAGVTSLSQLVVSVALFPVADIVSKLQSEEFFRILGSRRMQGVPLAMLDKSNPNYGFVRFLSDAFSRTSSVYMFPAFVTALIGVAISLVAPAALNVATILVESETVALAVGAVPAQGVYNASTTLSGFAGWDANQNSALAASVLWSEMELGANYSFSVAGSDADFAAYIVPSPIDLTTAVSAHWMTDVVGINPTCEWASTNISSTTQLEGNQSDSFSLTAGVYLQDLGLDVSITSLDFGLNLLGITVMSPLYHVFNHSTQGPPTDGSTIFAVSQCSTGCNNFTILTQVVLNWTDIPTFTLDVNADAYNQAQTWKFAFLACRPNAVIQTREVVSNGTGFLEILPVRQGKQYISQGNLHPTQTPLMLSLALSGITSSAGPMNISTTPTGSFSPVQNDFLFGRKQINALPQPSFDGQPIVVTILPTDVLAKTFAGMLQSVSKTYLAGFLGTAYVPAKVFTPQVVFVSSMPFIIASAVMFGILFILIIIMHFRRHEKAFTLVSISAALHGSNLPKHFALAEKSQALATNQRVVLQKGEDGTNVLQIINQ